MSGKPYPEAARRRLRPAVFLRIETDPPARAWTGVGGYVLPADAIEVEGGRYLGCGWMQNLPEISALLNGAAESKTITLSGVDARTLALVDGVDDVRGVEAHLGVMFYGARWARRPVRWFRRWRVDMAGTRETASDAAGGAEAGTKTVTLTLGSTRTSRRVGQPATWTHATQDELHPGDTGMAMVGRLTGDATNPWPPKG